MSADTSAVAVESFISASHGFNIPPDLEACHDVPTQTGTQTQISVCRREMRVF
jgi:hypothetical protein